MGPRWASSNCCLVVGRGAHRVLSINRGITQTTSCTIIFTGELHSIALKTFSMLQKSADYNSIKDVCLLNLSRCNCFIECVLTSNAH